MAFETSGDAKPAPVSAPTRRRMPIGLKVIIGLGLLQSITLILLGALLLVGRSDPDVVADYGVGTTPLTIAGTVLVLVGLVNAALAVMLARRSEGARSIFGALATFQVALAVFALVGQRDIEFDSLWALLLPVVLLWLLYGSDATQEYFEP